LDIEELIKEVEVLAIEAAGEKWCPNGGWQYPFDFGNNVIARTYTDAQVRLHPWRKNVLMNNLNLIYKNRYDTISVLDLGSGEGAMTLALWNAGVRDITCVEAREVNIKKAKFVFNHFSVDANIIHSSIDEFLEQNTKRFDLVIFMGILYHILNPFDVMKKIANITKDNIVVETVVAKVDEVKFGNRNQYSSQKDGFFVRIDTTESQTAGLSNLELWPTMGALDMLLEENNFTNLKLFELDEKAPFDYIDQERIFGIAQKINVNSLK